MSMGNFSFTFIVYRYIIVSKKEVMYLRKLILLFVLLFASFALIACGNGGTDIGEFPAFKEGDLIELSAQEMIALFENLEYTTSADETMRISASGYFKVTDSWEDDWWGDSQTTTTEATFDIVIYTLISQQVSKARLHAEGTIDFSSVSTYTPSSGSPSTSTNGAVGDVALYFINQFLYINMDAVVTNEGTPTDAVFKQKVRESLTQQQWEEVYNQENFENPEEMLPIPAELQQLLEEGDFDAIMDALPGLKVYKDGQTHSIVFEVTKAGILSSLSDIIRAVAAQVPEQPSEAEILEAIEQATEMINEMVDELSLKYVISVKENKITKIAIDVEFKSTLQNIEIDVLLIIDFGVTLPNFPSDLGAYTEVDEPGEGIFD